ncbi:hypothetical protein GA0115252_153017 [Streptomyces sp. DfronAA-171]|nr:hypothetical protein GA0115252_153017 [Streptomyces sp. DfronAA-171]
MSSSSGPSSPSPSRMSTADWRPPPSAGGRKALSCSPRTVRTAATTGSSQRGRPSVVRTGAGGAGGPWRGAGARGVRRGGGPGEGPPVRGRGAGGGARGGRPPGAGRASGSHRCRVVRLRPWRCRARSRTWRCRARSRTWRCRARSRTWRCRARSRTCRCRVRSRTYRVRLRACRVRPRACRRRCRGHVRRYGTRSRCSGLLHHQVFFRQGRSSFRRLPLPLQRLCEAAVFRGLGRRGCTGSAGARTNRWGRP